MVEIRNVGAIMGPQATQEQADRINEIVVPMAQVLLDLPLQEAFNVMGSLLMTYALRFDEPMNAAVHLVSNVLKRLPEAVEQATKAKH